MISDLFECFVRNIWNIEDYICWCSAPHQQYFFYIDLVNCIDVGNRNSHRKSVKYCMELTQAVLLNHPHSIIILYDVNNYTITVFCYIIMSHCGGTFASYVTFVKQHSLSRCWCLGPHQQYFSYVDLVNCLDVGNRNPHRKWRTYCMERTQTVFNHTYSTVRYEVNHHTIQALFYGF